MNIIRLLKNSNLDNYYNNKLANIYIYRCIPLNKYQIIPRILSRDIYKSYNNQCLNNELEKEYYFIKSQPFFFTFSKNIIYPISFYIIKEIIDFL